MPTDVDKMATVPGILKSGNFLIPFYYGRATVNGITVLGKIYANPLFASFTYWDPSSSSEETLSDSFEILACQ